MRRVGIVRCLMFSMILMAFVLTGCLSRSHCVPSVLTRLPNPESGHSNFMNLSAEVIKDDCGPATVRGTTSVRLVSNDKKFFPCAEGRVFSYSGGDPKISISWRDANTLVIRCSGCSPENVFWKVTKSEFISVVYEQ